MTTLAEVALSCAVQIGRANAAKTSIIDLESEIKAEIQEAIRFYNRKPWHLNEARNIVLTTVSGQDFYSTVDVSGASGDLALSGTIDVNDILDIEYMREASSSLTSGMVKMRYRDFERHSETVGPAGTPYYYTMYAGQIGIYPTPDSAYNITFSANVKPQVPVADADTSVWFTQAKELIEAAALKRVCLKHLRDTERAMEFGVIEQDALMQIESEHVRKTATGKIKAHC